MAGIHAIGFGLDLRLMTTLRGFTQNSLIVMRSILDEGDSNLWMRVPYSPIQCLDANSRPSKLISGAIDAHSRC